MRYTLYRLWDIAGQLLYIGKSIHRFQRIESHCRLQPWALEIAVIRFDPRYFADGDALSVAEVAANQAGASEV